MVEPGKGIWRSLEGCLMEAMVEEIDIGLVSLSEVVLHGQTLTGAKKVSLRVEAKSSVSTIVGRRLVKVNRL